MKKYYTLVVFILMIVVSLCSCCKVASLKNESDLSANTNSAIENKKVLTVNKIDWEQAFSEECLSSTLKNYTVTNLLDGGQWDTCVTFDRFSRISKTNEGELVIGVILVNGKSEVVQYTYNKETGWAQGVYDETDTVEQYVAEITKELTETLKVLADKFETTVWDEKQSAYVLDVEIPYDGPALADPSRESPEKLTFEVFFVDNSLAKINIIDGESKSVIHSFGTTPIPQVPDI